MKRTIGLDRELKLRWLDIGAGLAQAERDRIRLRARLMEALAADIPAHYVRVKTCTVLIRTWLTVPPEHRELRDRAFDLVQVVPPDQRLAVHWGMLLLAYPFFREVASAIGRSASMQNVVSRSQVSRKIVETWGERTTVKRSILRVFQSLSEWGILVQNGTEETFGLTLAREIHSSQLGLWLVETALWARGAAAPFSVITQAPENFPFRHKVALSDMIRSGRFETFREGADLLVGTISTADPVDIGF